MNTSAQRVTRRRDKMRAAGLRPIQIWVPDTRAPGFADACVRQCQALNGLAQTLAGRDEMDFWEAVGVQAWDDLDTDDT